MTDIQHVQYVNDKLVYSVRDGNVSSPIQDNDE